MFIIKRKNIDICKINYFWYIECIKQSDEVYEYWLCHKDYGIKLMMFELKNTNIMELIDYRKEDFIDLIKPYIEEFKERFFDL